MSKKVKEIDTSKYSNLSYEELSQISRNDHQEDTRLYDRQQNSLCLVVLGGISLVMALLFFFLSFKREMNKMGGLDDKSLQFIVSIICFVLAGILLSLGLTLVIIAQVKRLRLKDEILAVSLLKKDMMAKIE